ncbi:unnamed protein product [Rhizophagus irregularis]|nr:unnamed protein product [Rhizophagus irregularis]CAB4431739.1 unnamed protein product [Rhizophagus irregularis]
MRRYTNSELSEVAEVDNDVELNIKIDKEFRNEVNEIGSVSKYNSLESCKDSGTKEVNAPDGSKILG